MISVNVGKYVVSIQEDSLPWLYNEYCDRAKLIDKYDLKSRDGNTLFVSVGLGTDFPFLIITQKYWPCEGGFYPGVLLVEETDKLFIGAGERILIYDLKEVKKADEDFCDYGFLRWMRYKDYVIMIGEINVACWKTTGEKLWERFAEPPYDVSVSDDIVKLDIMGDIHTFDIEQGPNR